MCPDKQAFMNGYCKICPDGKMPNNDKTDCMCPIGQILKNNNCEDCPGSSVPNGNQTSCVCPQWQNSGTDNGQCKGR